MRNSWRVAGLSVAVPLLAFFAGCSENPTSQLDEPGKNPASHSGDESSFETLLCSSPVGGAVTPEPEYLNVGSMTAVIRDFQPNHSDFENFSEEATTQLEYESIAHLDLIYNYVTRTGVAMKDNGYGDDWYTAVPYHASCGTVSANEYLRQTQVRCCSLVNVRRDFWVTTGFYAGMRMRLNPLTTMTAPMAKRFGRTL